MRKILTIICFVLLAAPAWGANFYVDCSVSGGTAGAGTFADPFESFADIEAAAGGFSAGDDVYFLEGSSCEDEDDDLDVTWAGVDADNQAILGCYDGDGDFSCDGNRPVMGRLTNAKGSWSSEGGGVYSKSANYVIGLVQDGTVLDEENSVGAVNAAGEFFYNSVDGKTYLYPRGGGTPDATTTLTEGAGSYVIDIRTAHVKLTYLEFQDHPQPVVITAGTGSVIIDNCKFEDIFFNAIQVNNDVGADNNQFTNNIFNRVAMGAMYVYRGNDDGLIQGNVCDDMNYQEWSYVTNYSNPSDGHCGAIWSSTGWEISENKITDARDAIVIYGTNATTGVAADNVIKYNSIHGSAAYKTWYLGTSYGKGITIGADAGTDYHRDNIVMYNLIDQVADALYIVQPNSSGNGNIIVGNTVYDSEVCFRLRTTADYNTFKNNICSGTDIYHVWDDGTAGTNNTYDYNQYYPDTGGSAAPDFLYQGSNDDQLSDWQSGSGQDTNSATADPGLSDPANDDFNLTGALTGDTLDAAYDDALDPSGTDFSTTPPTVSTIQQTGTWDKGAFVYDSPVPSNAIQGVTIN